jgi:hypothetical protein
VVRVYSGRTGTKVREFLAFEPGMTAGVRVSAAYVTDDPYADVVASTGPGVADRVRVIDGATSKPIPGPTGEFAPLGGGRTGGVSLAASNDPPDLPGVDVPYGKTHNWIDAFGAHWYVPDANNAEVGSGPRVGLGVSGCTAG